MKNNLISNIAGRLREEYDDDESMVLGKEVLLHVMGLSVVQYMMLEAVELTEEEEREVNEVVERLLQHEPIQYIRGKVEFYGREFYVDRGVLIPRPETEELVEWVVSDHLNKTGLEVIDICTGSGCIAVSLSKEMKGVRVAALDISSEALEIAKKNAELHDVDIEIIEQDILRVESGKECYDIIVSNPPYITEKEKDEMEVNVLDYEPHLALFVEDDDPLKFYRVIAEYGLSALRSGGKLYFEINRAYSCETAAMLRNLGYIDIIERLDFYGSPRMIKATLP